MKNYGLLLLACCMLFFACRQTTSTISNIEFQNASPAEVGLVTDSITQLDTLLQDYVDTKLLAGAVAVVMKDGKIAYKKAFGHQDGEANIPMSTNTIFRMASMTKPITSLAAMILVEEGKLNVEDDVSKYIPEMAEETVFEGYEADGITFKQAAARRSVKVKHLLTHTSGLGYSFQSAEVYKIYSAAGVPDGVTKDSLTISETMPILADLPLMHHPGEKYTYGLSIDMLGYVVEVASGVPLDEFFQKRIFEPLNMNDSYFYLPEDKANRLAKLYVETENGVIPFNTVDTSGIEMSFVDGARSYFSGGGGLCSTAEDYAIFLQMILNGGELNGTRILKEETMTKMLTSQMPDSIYVDGNDKYQFGYGFSINIEASDDFLKRPKGRFSWGGLFGTTFWGIPDENMSAILLTQTYPQPSRSKIYHSFESLVNGAIKK